MEVDDILLKANELLKAGPPVKNRSGKSLQGAASSFSTPRRVLLFTEFLSDRNPEDFIGKALVHVYEKPKMSIDFSGGFVIVHGHSSRELCSGPTLCHEKGYKPKITDNPAFVKQFNLKWGFLYNKEGE